MLLPEETLPDSHTSSLLCPQLCPLFIFFSKHLLSVPYVSGTVLDPEGTGIASMLPGVQTHTFSA